VADIADAELLSLIQFLTADSCAAINSTAVQTMENVSSRLTTNIRKKNTTSLN